VWAVGRVAKRQEMFFYFSFLTGKETRNQTELEHERRKKKRNGAVLYRRPMGLQKPKSGRSQMCVQKHWIAQPEIINKKFLFSFLFFIFLSDGSWGEATQIYSQSTLPQ
jgi:hypothetical protein